MHLKKVSPHTAELSDMQLYFLRLYFLTQLVKFKCVVWIICAVGVWVAKSTVLFSTSPSPTVRTFLLEWR